MTPSHEYATAFHSPVLAHEVVELFRDASRILDCTLGGGGHALALLERGADVTGLDRDPRAIAEASARLSAYRDAARFRAILANFADIDESPVLEGRQFEGIFLDLGTSTHQVDEDARGFTFRQGAPLDMRMNPDAAHNAADFLNEADERELVRVFRAYGDAGARAGSLARQIVRRRQTRSFQTSDDLVGAIRAVAGPRSGPPDFAPIFQAVRIAVNDELDALGRALPQLRDRLTRPGILAVIAYHSGEDRLVKHAFREWSASCICPPRQPVCTCRGRSLGTTLTPKPIVAGEVEVARNPRARSARLRAWQSAA